jgi:hypothetical protein
MLQANIRHLKKENILIPNFVGFRAIGVSHGSKNSIIYWNMGDPLQI